MSSVLTTPLTAFVVSDQPYVMADFEGPSALQNWRFSTGLESPGSGTLAIGPGHREHGALLKYRLPCERDATCDSYAAALWRAAIPFPKKHNPAISLWIRFPPQVRVALLITDSSGQSLRFPIPLTLEHYKAGDWQYVVVPLSAKNTSAGGSSPRVRGRLVEIGIAVQARSQLSVEGAVSFDDLALRDSPGAFRLDPAAQLTSAPLESSEKALQFGVNIHLLRDDRSLDLAQSAGFQFVRMDMLWTNIERRGRFRFFAYDALLRASEARGMGVLWILDYGHPDHGGSVPRRPEDLAAFGRFAEAAATHFRGRNVSYEIWNEPNVAQFWATSPNAAEYKALLREALVCIRRADPSAKVLSGGLSKMDLSFLSEAVDPAIAAELTAVAIHPYPKTGPETIVPELEDLREWVTQKLGGNTQIWNTEWGYSSSNALRDTPSNGHTKERRRLQAVLAVREMLTVCVLALPLNVWYDLRDDGPDPANPDHNYGLLDSNRDEKPAMKALSTFMSALKEHKYAGMIGDAPSAIHAMKLSGPADAIFIVWTDEPGSRHKIQFSRDQIVSVADFMGEPLKPKNGFSGEARVEISEAAGPIYLRCAYTGVRANSSN